MKLTIIIISISVWLAFIYGTAKYDAWRDKNKKAIIHWVNALYRTIFFIALVLTTQMIQFKYLVAGFTGFALFSYSIGFNLLFNKFTGRPYYALGKAWTDRHEAKIGFSVAFFIKTFLLIVSIFGIIAS